jgi:hypothetical protein
MNNLEYIFHIFDGLYDKNQNVKAIIEGFFHEDYNQCINGVVLNRLEYINHVIEQRRTIESIEFKHKKHLSQLNELFLIYDVKGKNIQGNDIEAEIISYFEFKDKKLFRIHGHVHLLKGSPSDVDMREDNI